MVHMASVGTAESGRFLTVVTVKVRRSKLYSIISSTPYNNNVELLMMFSFASCLSPHPAT